MKTWTKVNARFTNPKISLIKDIGAFLSVGGVLTLISASVSVFAESETPQYTESPTFWILLAGLLFFLTGIAILVLLPWKADRSRMTGTIIEMHWETTRTAYNIDLEEVKRFSLNGHGKETLAYPNKMRFTTSKCHRQLSVSILIDGSHELVNLEVDDEFWDAAEKNSSVMIYRDTIGRINRIAVY